MSIPDKTTSLNEVSVRTSDAESVSRSDSVFGKSSEDSTCAFCAIVARNLPATVVWEDDLTIAFLDLRQYHIGHVLIIPKLHVNDIRQADDETAMAVMRTTAQMARAVNAAFPCEGMSVWHSAGEAANQEVPHLHFHVHPRKMNDGVLRIYPETPTTPGRALLEAWGVQLREQIARG